jgi:hypothetical protein
LRVISNGQRYIKRQNAVQYKGVNPHGEPPSQLEPLKNVSDLGQETAFLRYRVRATGSRGTGRSCVSCSLIARCTLWPAAPSQPSTAPLASTLPQTACSEYLTRLSVMQLCTNATRYVPRSFFCSSILRAASHLDSAAHGFFRLRNLRHAAIPCPRPTEQQPMLHGNGPMADRGLHQLSTPSAASARPARIVGARNPPANTSPVQLSLGLGDYSVKQQ